MDFGHRAVVFTIVAEWIHFTLFGIILPTIKLKVYTFGGLTLNPKPLNLNPEPGLMNSATKYYQGSRLGLRILWYRGVGVEGIRPQVWLGLEHPLLEFLLS